MLWLRHAFVPQKVRAPAARLVELPPLVEGHAIAVGHVRLQSGLIGGQNARQLRADVLSRLLDRLQPREFCALEELDRRELRNIEEGRLRCVAPALAGQEVDAAVDTTAARTSAVLTQSGEPLLDCPGQRGVITTHRFRSEEHTSELQSPYDLVCR